MPVKPIIVKIDEKNAVVIRIDTYRDVEKVYIQGGYVPGETYDGELMVDPCKEWPKGLAFGKAVTFSPTKFELVKAAILSFQLKAPQKAAAKPKATKLASNAVTPTVEAEPEF